jgi:hypothetical protein
MSNPQLPTPLELWYDGSYVCSFRNAEIIRYPKDNNFYAVIGGGKEVIPLPDYDLKMLLA